MNYMYLERIPSNKVLRLTKNGLDGLRQRLDALTAQRSEVFDFIRTTRKDFENTNDLLTHEKINELERGDSELTKILHVLENATTIRKDKQAESIDIGSDVVLSNGQGKVYEYTIVCSLEVDLEQNKISDESPVGRLLMGKKVHDTFSITSPSGNSITYTVMAIQ